MTPNFMTPRFHFYKLFLLSLLALISFAFSVHAELNPQQEIRYRELIQEFRCPTCQGLSVKDSEAGFSVQIRNKVKELLQEGLTNQEIKDYFVERYGVWILRAPPKEGFNLLLWILPGAGLVLGLGVLFWKSKRWTKKSEMDQKVASEEDSELTEEELKKINRDMKRFESS